MANKVWSNFQAVSSAVAVWVSVSFPLSDALTQLEFYQDFSSMDSQVVGKLYWLQQSRRNAA